LGLLELELVTFLWLKFAILLLKKVPSNMVKGTFEKNLKNSAHFEEEESYEIAKNFIFFWRI
jgi:hypothetical protein